MKIYPILLLSFLVASCGGGSGNGGTETLNTDPVAVLDDKALYLGQSAVLDGSDSIDVDGDEITYSWLLVSSPPGSAWMQFDETAIASFDFLPDIEGEYVVRLSVTDDRGGSSSVEATVTAVEPFAMLDYRPIDAEYSRALDRIILVSEASNRVHVLDPATMEESEIGLNLLPTAVSVSPDGLFAAVGHDGWVSHVDLVNGTVLDVIPVGADAGDVVIAGNGHIYVFPSVDQWVSIHSLETASGLETKSRDTIFAATLAKLHPDGVSVYGANNGLSPSDMEKYSIDGGTAEVLYDSPYHGDYAICGDLWISEDGMRVFTKCGSVFRSTSSRDTDMTYNGSFDDVEGIAHLSHSAAADEIALVPIGDWWDESDEELQYVKRFSYEFLQYQGKVKLPSVIAGNVAYPTQGEYIFHASDGTAYAVVKAVGESALLNDYGVWKLPAKN